MVELLAMRQTLFLRDFTVLDFAFLSERQGLLGESLYVSVELEGELDAQGFILDFGPAKKILKKLVDDALDHRLLVPAHARGLRGTAAGFAFAGVEYESPAEAVALLEAEAISPALIEAHLAALARELLPANVSGVRFSLREEPRFAAEPNFRYTHGLRLHEGNCQRLLHGHRNPIEVWVDGARSEKAESFLAAAWAGAHFTFGPTLLNRKELDLPLGRRLAKEGMAEIAYEAPQGAFRALLPASKVVLLETEPSIENIARLGAEVLRQEGLKAFRVVAYEGLNKGASFSLPPPQSATS